ncbi:M48 family metalloprotease [Rickettsiales endosymbiont of Stachyamoeba lipophora]|uniref:M48 family metalloprotease n=1 Tax=Rickettsiales endosymbiont of Stachyamoeba lipophora TaxID=2486578 RepID=UPI000F65527E|nr:M48 family metalloprotease [Rickettsiales endosymbiont of Stachyamoeba lipophora]AZL15637.1 hypothetical protein EF513_03620 [Rickettsiales endosymbiont of Stachyamoeba lipophora]
MKFVNYLVLCILLAFASHGEGLSIIRDAEIESYLNELTKPLFKAANLKAKTDIIIVNDHELNAFTIPGNKIFIHTGLIANCDSPEMLAGVIAHEIGHIIGGHFFSRQDVINKNNVLAVASTFLGLMVAGLNQEIGAGIAMGGTHSALSNIFAFTRSQESMADIAALDILKKTDISTKGLSSILRKIYAQERIVHSDNTYYRTHPLSMERINLIDKNSYLGTQLNNFNFKLIKSKITAYLAENNGHNLLKKIKHSNNPDDLYTKSILYLRQNKFQDSRVQLSQLIKAYPSYPYFYELAGIISFKQNQYDDFISNYEKAIKLTSNNILRIEFGTNLLSIYESTNNQKYFNLAFNHLLSALSTNPDYMTYYNIARAYNLKGDPCNSNYYLAKAALLIGDEKEAKFYANTALKQAGNNPKLKAKIQDLLK